MGLRLAGKYSRIPLELIPILSKLDYKDYGPTPIYVLGKAGPDGAAAVKPLLAMIEKYPDNSSLIISVLFALRSLGPAAMTAVPKIQQLSSSSNPQIAKAAQSTLDRLRALR